MRTRSPIKWYGGKSRFTQHLLPLIPDHHCYCEVFGGAASLLFAKEPSKVEVYNDLDSGVVAFFRIFHDHDALEVFKRKCFYTSYSRELYFEYQDTWQEQTDPIERAYRWFVMNRMAFNGRMYNGGWSCGPTRNWAKHMTRAIDNLDNFVGRLRNVQIDNRGWEQVIQAYDDSTTLFYLDPPYLLETRKDTNSYNHEMSRDDHENLIECIRDIKGMVLLSGYRNDVYDRLGWTRLDIEVHASSAVKKGDKGNPDNKRTECLWRNYEIQPTLF